MPVLVRSRVDDSVYPGTIYKINTDSTENSQTGYYDMGSGDSASKYAFYVELESIEGLMIGQHVFIDLNTAEQDDARMMLPAAFVMQENERFYVWAVGANNRIEKREIEVDAYDEATECYPVVGGLTVKDRIAFPDDTVLLVAQLLRFRPDGRPERFGLACGGMVPILLLQTLRFRLVAGGVQRVE